MKSKNVHFYIKLDCFIGDTIPQAVDLIPMLIQTVTKASGQANQSNIVAEGVTASCLLVKLSLVDIQAGKYFHTLDKAKYQFFSIFL